MNPSFFDPVLQARFRMFSAGAGVFAILMGVAVMLAWIFDLPYIRGIHPDWITMKGNTALGITLLGMSLLLLQERPEHPPSEKQEKIAWVCLGIVFLIGILTAIQYAFQVDLKIDRWLFYEPPGTPGTFSPGRPAPITAISFVLLSSALFVMARARGSCAHQYLVALPAFLSLIPLVGYIYGVAEITGLDIIAIENMAFNTVISIIALSLGIFFARPGQGLMTVVTSNTAGGTITRRLLPLLILIIPSLHIMTLFGEKAGYFDQSSARIFFMSLSIGFSVLVTFYISGLLHRSDLQRQQVVAELIQSNNTLDNLNRELEAFSYSVSHDLRAPLRSIDGFSKLVLGRYGEKLDGEGAKYLRFIEENSQLMGQLIDDLLNLSRLSRAELKTGIVNLSELAKSIAEELKAREPDREVTCVIQPNMIVEGDPQLLRIALQNLINNAWKYTRQRTYASVEFGRGDENGELVYFVKDNGAGFDMAYAGKLFGAFQRLHSMHEYPGTGIGLATVKRIIHRHGGQVWADAEVDKGAVFYFTLKSREAN